MFILKQRYTQLVLTVYVILQQVQYDAIKLKQ